MGDGLMELNDAVEWIEGLARDYILLKRDCTVEEMERVMARTQEAIEKLREP
jgi:hypothetical protein